MTQNLMQLAPLFLIFGLFYVMLIMPMRKRQKALQELVQNLKRGDKVTTNGGLYGEVAALIGGRDVLLKIADNVKVKIAKSAITGLESDEKGGSDEAQAPR